MPDLLGAACGLGTMKALSQLPLLLLCLAIPCLLFLSSFLPLWLGVGTRWHLYLDTDEVLLGGQKQPFIQGGGGSGISPAVTSQARSLVQGQKPRGAQKELPLQDPAVMPHCVPSAFSGLPSPLGPTEKACCHGACHHATCSVWSPIDLSPDSQRLPLGMEEGKETLSHG
jgi:hypothetical protein